ncbi:hypothetical protein [Saccharothrix sp. Mg75]|uniref:hypothetical protein n=1 Tax=Saccharothrix sp. Mg75 TaxID=3445357 RepID=UPI003EE9B008
MSDLRVLRDAFGELERRADAVTAERPFERPRPARSGTAPRLVLAAVAVVAVAGAAAGISLLVPEQPAGTQVAGPPTTSPTSSAPATSAPPTPPDTPAALAERFRAVLGDSATFTVTDGGPGLVVIDLPAIPAPGSSDAGTPASGTPASGVPSSGVPASGTPSSGTPSSGVPSSGTPSSGTSSTPASPGKQVGASIRGTLTAAGVSGGYDLVVYPTNRGVASCDGIPGSDCVRRDLPDGSSLITQRVALDVHPGGVTHVAALSRADGLQVVFHVSNVEDPKGRGALLAAAPPLTLDRMTEIITSDLW